MKKVYLVHERSVINGKYDRFYGVAYYSSLVKANKEFDNRCKTYNIKYSKKEGEKLPIYNGYAKISEDTMVHVQLVAHEVY